ASGLLQDESTTLAEASYWFPIPPWHNSYWKAIEDTQRYCRGMNTLIIRRIGFVLAFCAMALFGQRDKIVWSEQARPLVEQLQKLRSMTDADRAVATKTLALEIRKLGAAEKSMLAQQLAGLA